jgi:hypothetical protein
MTKNTTREDHDKHTQQIRNGTLPFWKEVAKQDSSVTKSQSLAASTVTTSPGDSSISTSRIVKATIGQEAWRPDRLHTPVRSNVR